MIIGVVGCGGTGGWTANLLAKMLQPEDTLVLIDKDKFERHNMDRQLNCKVGMNKAVALTKALANSRCRIEGFEQWFNAVFWEHKLDCLFCCADNHRARIACLDYADSHECTAYIGGNEYSSFDACAYRSFMQGDENLDPRVRFPEMLTSTEGDPLSPSCTGEVLESSPQLALANMQTATALCRLWYTWEFIVPKLGFGFNLNAAEHEDADEMYRLSKTIEVRISGNDNKLYVERLQ